MRFSTLIASLAIMATSTSASSLTQFLSSSFIADLTTIDTNTQQIMNEWRQYESINTDMKTNVKTTIVTKQLLNSPFNQTISYEQAQLSGTGGSSLDGPIYDYSASAFATSLTSARTWTSCAASSMSTRQPDYCSEVASQSDQTVTCGRDNKQTCTIIEVVCRHNNIIQLPEYYMIDTTTQAIVASMETKDATQITYWSNIITTPTSGQFGDSILLPTRTSCPDQNDKFPAIFGTAPIMPTSSTPTSTPITKTSSSSSSGTSRFPSSSSTGSIQFGAATSSIPAISAIIMLLPAIMTAVLRV